jgi:alpha-1,6-mannosyltransferase
MCLHTRNGQWVGDFWEHSAVVRELATHILHPKHPQLLLDTPHAFYSPYSVMVAFFARLMQWDAVKALSIMGLVNLCLLFSGLRLFVYSMVPMNKSATDFYTLLLTLFCWGSHPWFYSGFFHIDVLRYVLPYPSTFAAALTLITLGCNQFRIETKRQILFGPILLLTVIILITHLITFLLLAAGLFSQSFTEKGSTPSMIILVGSLLSLAFMISALWPYFSMVKLLLGESDVYNASNRIMYRSVLSRIWPSLIGLPLIIASVRSNWRHSLALMLVILSGIYVFGALSGKYAYGRVISYIVLLLHVAIAEHLAKIEHRAKEIHNSSWLRQMIVPAIAIIFTLILSWKPLGRTFANSLRELPPTYKNYLFLSRFTGQYDVVLSDIKSSWILPTFGGKAVAALHYLAFVSDHDARRSDLESFFNKKTAFAERQRIIHKYNTNYLLLKKSKKLIWRDLRQSFMTQGASCV